MPDSTTNPQTEVRSTKNHSHKNISYYHISLYRFQWNAHYCNVYNMHLLRLLGWVAVCFDRQIPTLLNKQRPPSSEYSSLHSTFLFWICWQFAPLKYWYLSNKIPVPKSKKTIIWILTVLRTSNLKPCRYFHMLSLVFIVISVETPGSYQKLYNLQNILYVLLKYAVNC